MVWIHLLELRSRLLVVYDREMEHTSFSQFKSYTACPRQWYLNKVRGGEEVQSWFLPIGTVVHDAIEARLQGEPFDITKRFYELVAAQMLIEPDLSFWLAGGPQADPIVEEKALQRAVDCYEKALEELEDIEVWEVEYEATGRLPGLSVPIKAFVDIVGEHKTKGPVIWDWKTGSTKPDNFQLETYAALLKARFDPKFKGYDWHGRYMMISPTYTSQTRYVDLSEVDPAEVGAKYQAVVDRIEGKHYEAKAGFNCKFCFQSENCLVNKGMTKRAAYYDRSEERGFPF